MRSMFFAVLAVLAFAVPVFAGQPEGRPEGEKSFQEVPFEQRKAHILSLLEKRSARLQEAKSCVQAAATSDDLEKCRDERSPVLQEKLRRPRAMVQER